MLNAWPQLVSFAPVYQADLAKIGVTLERPRAGAGDWVDEAVNRKYNGLYLANSTFAQLEPSSTLNNGRATDPNSNNSLFQNEEYSQLIATASVRTGRWPSARRCIRKLNDILLDESFIMVLAGGPPTLVARSKVHGNRAQRPRRFLLPQHVAYALTATTSRYSAGTSSVPSSWVLA